MISFTKADLEAIAMISPVTANCNKVNMDELIARAHYERSAYITGLFKSGFKKIADAYRTRRQNSLAIAQLQSMSNRELSDMGVARCDISRAVLGEAAVRTPLSKKIATVLAPYFAKYEGWRSHRAGYAQLMAMDTRQLSDIGLTRGDIAAAVAGKGTLANDNVIAPANNNGGRKVS